MRVEHGRTWHTAERRRSFTTRDGIEILHENRSMTDLSFIADGSVDLVFSGESIEHVTREDGTHVLTEAFRILRPGGSVCIDTPNAFFTRMQSPDELVHPEHAHEYTVEELRYLVRDAGFEIVRELGICALRRARATGVFDETEIIDGRGLCPDPEDGYLFYVEGRKPSATRAFEP